ncbi:MAG: DUF433 domain-containing protein [Tepidisphaeraceae bacterium]
MVRISFQDRDTERKALAFLLGRFSGRVLKDGEHLVPEAALEALAEQPVDRTNVCYNPAMDWHAHIERVPGVMLGKPVFRGTRITVEFVLERLAQGARPEDLVRSHPPLTPEHVTAALAYALSVVRQDELLLSPT